MEQRMITTKEAAELLGVSPTRVRQLAIDGMIQGVKLTGAWFFTREQVEQAKARNLKPGPKRKSQS